MGKSADDPCRFLTRSPEAYSGLTLGSATTRVIGPQLCDWAHQSDEAVLQMTGLPIWVQRHAQAGLMRDPDCEVCPAYQPRTAEDR
jgi:hypothetical protein